MRRGSTRWPEGPSSTAWRGSSDTSRQALPSTASPSFTRLLLASLLSVSTAIFRREVISTEVRVTSRSVLAPSEARAVTAEGLRPSFNSGREPTSA